MTASAPSRISGLALGKKDIARVLSVSLPLIPNYNPNIEGVYRMLKRILISLSVLGVLALFSCNAAYADPSVPVATPIGVEDKAIEVILTR